jgi:hypothetical protein
MIQTEYMATTAKKKAPTKKQPTTVYHVRLAPKVEALMEKEAQHRQKAKGTLLREIIENHYLLPN